MSTETNIARLDEQNRANKTLLKKLGVIVVAMFGFGYALVPFYDKICEAAGLRNIARADEAVNTQVDTKRDVRIEFDSNVRELAWTFKALEPIVNVHPGEVRQVVFEVVNSSAHALTGQAIPSFGPAYAGQYFKKMECFCFSQQTLAAGETRRMPVVFVVDPNAPADLATITLSYTFFPIEGGKS
ncbi:MAG: cytochrome c oxidase assembly protein [Betaproteobacteria bacterium]